MKKKLTLPLLAAAVLLLFSAAYAASFGTPTGYQLLTTIAIPGGLTGFDISWVDTGNARYYLADRGNATVTPPVPPRIDVIDTENDKYLYSIDGFNGPNGVVSIRRSAKDSGELYVGDNNSLVRVVDLGTRAIVATIPTNGTGRADELAYDPLHHIVLIANDNDNPPFLSFISTDTRTVLGKISYPQAVYGDPPTNHGLEQPVWFGPARRFYQAVPSTLISKNGEIDEIDPVTMTVTRIFPTTCNPAGLASIPLQRLMTSCGDVLDIATGNVLMNVGSVGADEIWFNPGDERVYFGGGKDFISVNVVEADFYKIITTLTVGLIVSPSPFSPANHITHSVAADSDNDRIFVPVSNEGIKVYTPN